MVIFFILKKIKFCIVIAICDLHVVYDVEIMQYVNCLHYLEISSET